MYVNSRKYCTDAVQNNKYYCAKQSIRDKFYDIQPVNQSEHIYIALLEEEPQQYILQAIM